MFGKILLTLGVILGVYLAVLGTRRPDTEPKPAPPLPAPAWIRTLAYGLVGLLIAGTLVWFYRDWAYRQGIVDIQVINANTGAITRYRARRGAIQGRQFTTLEGERVTLADIERMILKPP